MNIGNLLSVLTFEGLDISLYALRQLYPGQIDIVDPAALNSEMGTSYSMDDLLFIETKFLTAKTIDKVAGESRLRHSSNIYNQNEILNEKVSEAIDFIINPNPQVCDYPFIRARCNATGEQPRDVADLFIRQRRRWVKVNAQIEELRERGKFLLLKIPVTGSIDDVNAVRKSITEELHKL